MFLTYFMNSISRNSYTCEHLVFMFISCSYAEAQSTFYVFLLCLCFAYIMLCYYTRTKNNNKHNSASINEMRRTEVQIAAIQLRDVKC